MFVTLCVNLFVNLFVNLLIWIAFIIFVLIAISLIDICLFDWLIDMTDICLLCRRLKD